MRQYDHKKIEQKWQKEWKKKGLYKVSDKQKGQPSSAKASKGKGKNFFLLVEFPYPSGNLHVGHWYAFSVPDILARAMRMQGKNVLYPIGFDAFGLPAENAAIKNKINPRKWTEKNIAYMKKQIESMGTSFDWSRMVETCDPSYYKWTQWQFLQFFKKGLAYQKDTPVNWCPSCKTVLANEQVENGHCERCKTEVEQRQMLQWNMKITDYADRLVDDLDPLDWPEQIKESQRNWIGRSEGAEINFQLSGSGPQQIKRFVLLHGRTEKASNAAFLPWLKQELERQGYEVEVPNLPNAGTPDDEEQADYVQKHCTVDEKTAILGHSFGGVVVLRLLERSVRPASVLFVGTPFTSRFLDGKKRPDVTVAIKKGFDFAKIKENLPHNTIALYDIGDQTVPLADGEELSKKIGCPFVQHRAESPHFKGRSEPEILKYVVPSIKVFTTRADTLFGATYLVLAPEHPWVTQALKHPGRTGKTVLKNSEEVATYVRKSQKKTELERQENKEKTGVELKGVKAINPATGKEIPVWIADYVLGHYGTGAIMAVPAHDERDGEFAKKFNLPIQEVVVEQVGKRHKNGEYRRVAITVVENKKGDILVQSKKVDGKTYYCLPGGGVDEGETIEEGALRETREETGYRHFSSVEEIGTIEANFFNPVRDIQRRALATGYVVKLANETQNAPELTEQEARFGLDHEWMSKGEALKILRSEKGCSGEDVTLLERYLSGCHQAPYTGEGLLTNSGEFSDMESADVRKKMAEKYGSLKTTYKMRDWVVSRQRYWGVPIPIIHCAECGPQAVPDKDLPVKLPEVKDYLPDGRGKSPLAKATKWVSVKCPKCKGKAERETDTLDTFVDSSWYFLRYADPKNKTKFADAKKLDAWMPVNLYSGGAEHTTMHVLYSRFWQKALYDLKLVKDKEPYTRRMNRSLILGPDGQKMSKSRGNIIDPDKVVEQLGSDTVRMYLAFIGPYNEVSNYPWNPDSVVGVRRFLERVWNYVEGPVDWKYVYSLGRNDPFFNQENTIPETDTALNKMIKQVTEDIEKMKFNTAISAMMIFLNHMKSEPKVEYGQSGARIHGSHGHTLSKPQLKKFLRVLAPFAPHITEELWHSIGEKQSIHLEEWPKFDAKKLVEKTVTMVVQVNGKVRGQISIESDADKALVEKAAQEAVGERLEGKTISRTIVVPNRLVNFVVPE